MELGTKRSSLQVIGDILRIGGSKTQVMYGANLSHAQTEKYLDLLITHRLVDPVKQRDGRYRYTITERGQKFLTLLDAVETFISELPR